MERLSFFVSDMIIIEVIILLLFLLYRFLNKHTIIFFSHKAQSSIIRIKNIIAGNTEGVLFVFIVYTLMIKIFIMFCNFKWKI